MRWIHSIVLPGLILMSSAAFFATARLHLDDDDLPREGARVPQEDTCSDPAAHAEGGCVADAELREAMIRQGVKLLRDEATVKAAELIEQLDRSGCALQLPPPSEPVYGRPELYRRAKASVVVVGGIYKCDKCVRWHASTASGFVISRCGAVVTNYHVIEGAEDRTLVIMTADERVFPVLRVLAASRENDLAIFQVDAPGLEPLPLSDDIAPVGSSVNVISHPDGRYYCLTAGIVSRYSRDRRGSQTVTITADYARGSSGAPVLDDRGRVVAVVCSTHSVYYSESERRQQNLQMVFKSCIPSACLRELIRPAEEVAAAAAMVD